LTFLFCSFKIELSFSYILLLKSHHMACLRIIVNKVVRVKSTARPRTSAELAVAGLSPTAEQVHRPDDVQI
jgi:hypothetical protein